MHSGKRRVSLSTPSPLIILIAPSVPGEVEYITDIPDAPNQLFAYFVTAQAPANSVIASIDPSEALVGNYKRSSCFCI